MCVFKLASPHTHGLINQAKRERERERGKTLDDLICLEEKESVLVAVVRCTAHSHLQREHGLVCHVSWAPRRRPAQHSKISLIAKLLLSIQ